MSQLLDEYRTYRTRMNERILALDSKIIKRVYSVDSQTYEPGALDARTKELLGLACSAVLRCDDCVRYHLESALKAGATPQQLTEALEVSLVVGGTIVIPHLRRAIEFMDALVAEADARQAEVGPVS